jgi:hypothetical protein
MVDGARVRIAIDIGFGAAIEPGASERERSVLCVAGITP